MKTPISIRFKKHAAPIQSQVKEQLGVTFHRINWSRYEGIAQALVELEESNFVSPEQSKEARDKLTAMIINDIKANTPSL